MTHGASQNSVEEPPTRTAYGPHRDVVRIQALVPDEPVEATLQVARTWRTVALVAGWALAFPWIFYADQQGVLRSRWNLAVVVVMILLGVLPVVVSGLVRDRVSPVRVGAWQRGAVAVTPTRILVVRRSFWTGRPVAVSRELDRATLPAALGWSRRMVTTLRLVQPDGRTVALRVPRARDIAQRTAAALVVGPAGTRWSVDPRQPAMARVWSDGRWTATTDHLFNVQTGQVQLPTG